MSFSEFFMLGFWGQVYRRRGVEVEYGNDGFPGELWLSATNKDDQWNVRSMLEYSGVHGRVTVLRRL